MSNEPNTQYMRIEAVLKIDNQLYPREDVDCQHWLINDILLGDVNGLVLISNEVGDEVGLVEVRHVEELPGGDL